MVNEPASKLNVFRGILGAVCAGILCVILIAGFWPFHAPKNQVGWLTVENGIRFGHRGIVVSTKAFRSTPLEGPGSLEICLQPTVAVGSGTILAFDDSPEPKDSFALRQFDGSLAIQRPGVDAEGNLVRAWWRTDGVFRVGKWVVLTITSAQGKSLLYVDGVPASVSWDFRLAPQDLTGKLVLGSSMVRDSWSGQINGLAIYDTALAPAEIAEHATRWLRGQTPVATGQEPPAALYRFDERGGDIIHDRTEGNNSLVIPARYFVMHPGFLTPVWSAYHSRWDGWMTWSYWSDAFVNIAAFVPFGFFFAAWFSISRRTSHARVTAVVFGFTISLIIESLQYFLPTRDSSMTDLLTNTIGTVLGSALYRPQQMHWLLRTRS